MVKRVFAFIVRLGVLGAVLYAARSAMKRWVDGPEPSTSPGVWSGTGPEFRVVPPEEPVGAARPAFSPPPPAAPSPVAAPALEDATDPALETAGPVETVPEWVVPDATGAAPSSHPVKVKLASKVYREPGSSGYDRCRADRCYTTAEAAEADGFTRAKR